MAFELIIKEQSISADAGTLNISDISDWNQEVRSNFGLSLLADQVESDLTSVPLEVTGNDNDPLTDANWDVLLKEDGRLRISLYAHLRGLTTDIGTDGEVRYLSDIKVVRIYKIATGTWDTPTTEELILGAAYASLELNISMLQGSYNYKNRLNLIYITKIKQDLAEGASQNELYYRRTELDYVNSLIVGAEYNFGLALYTIYYDIVKNLNNIIETGKLS